MLCPADRALRPEHSTDTLQPVQPVQRLLQGLDVRPRPRRGGDPQPGKKLPGDVPHLSHGLGRHIQQAGRTRPSGQVGHLRHQLGAMGLPRPGGGARPGAGARRRGGTRPGGGVRRRGGTRRGAGARRGTRIRLRVGESSRTGGGLQPQLGLGHQPGGGLRALQEHPVSGQLDEPVLQVLVLQAGLDRFAEGRFPVLRCRRGSVCPVIGGFQHRPDAAGLRVPLAGRGRGLVGGADLRFELGQLRHMRGDVSQIHRIIGLSLRLALR